MERPPVDLADVLAFVRTVEMGSVSRAAVRLGVSKSIVSRRLAALEASLGAQLLTRAASGATPTELGRGYYARTATILAELDAANEAVSDAVTRIAGTIRLTAPLSFGVRHLAPALAEFGAAHPAVLLDVSFDDRVVDLMAGGLDLAIRIGSLRDSDLLARRLAPVRAVVAASPAYLERAGRPLDPQDLLLHDLLVYSHAGPEQFRFPGAAGRFEAARLKVRLRTDNGDMLREAAIAGLGVAILPNFIAAEALETGELEPVLLDWPLPEGGLHAVMPPSRARTARVRALVDFLAARFGSEPLWDPCWRLGSPG